MDKETQEIESTSTDVKYLETDFSNANFLNNLHKLLKYACATPFTVNYGDNYGNKIELVSFSIGREDFELHDGDVTVNSEIFGVRVLNEEEFYHLFQENRHQLLK